MASKQLTNRYQAISLTSVMTLARSCAAEDGNTLPASTPITPPAVGISHRQFCEDIIGKSLPGGNNGRGSFDTLT